jgi:hypothetical protein
MDSTRIVTTVNSPNINTESSGLVSSGTGVLSGWSSSTSNPYTMQGITGINTITTAIPGNGIT